MTFTIEVKAEPGPDAQGCPMFKGFYRIDGKDWVRATGLFPTALIACRHAAVVGAGDI